MRVSGGVGSLAHKTAPRRDNWERLVIIGAPEVPQVPAAVEEEVMALVDWTALAVKCSGSRVVVGALQ